jgi:hypothetical protein
MTGVMRQALHIAIGLAFWLVLIGLWVLLATEGRASGDAFANTGLELAALIGAVLALTTWWIRHNVGIYRKKGPRRGRPDLPPNIDEDRLGHPLRWEMPGGPETATAAAHVVVELEAGVKTYRQVG